MCYLKKYCYRKHWLPRLNVVDPLASCLAQRAEPLESFQIALFFHFFIRSSIYINRNLSDFFLIKAQKREAKLRVKILIFLDLARSFASRFFLKNYRQK